MKLPQDLKDFIELLNSHNCQYLMIGGWAFNYYADARPTGDFDFFVPISDKSERDIRNVLIDFGFESVVPDQSVALLKREKVIMLGRKPLRIDIITDIDGVSFQEAWDSKVQANLDGVKTHIISKELLVKNKSSTGRDKDMRDVSMLQNLD